MHMYILPANNLSGIGTLSKTQQAQQYLDDCSLCNSQKAQICLNDNGVLTTDSHDLTCPSKAMVKDVVGFQPVVFLEY